MRKMLDVEELITPAAQDEDEDADAPPTTSFLSKLFKENVEFRRIATLLHWSEEIAYNRPKGFSQCLKDQDKLQSLSNI